MNIDIAGKGVIYVISETRHGGRVFILYLSIHINKTTEAETETVRWSMGVAESMLCNDEFFRDPPDLCCDRKHFRVSIILH